MKDIQGEKMATIKKAEALEVLDSLRHSRLELLACTFAAHVSVAKDGGGHWQGAPDIIATTLGKVNEAIDIMEKYYD